MSARRTAAKNLTKLPAGRNTKRKVTDGTARGHAGGGYVVTPRTPHALRRRTVHTRRRPLHASVTRRPLHGVCYTASVTRVRYTASVTRRLLHASQISLRFANWLMKSPARKARAWMVIVGWPLPDVTKLEPSHRNRLGTSCVR